MAESSVVGKLKLNLGCGNRKIEGFLNVDSQPGCQPDMVLDLEATPWPWADDSVDEVQLIHVLEHLGQAPAVYLGIMRELWRVCCDGAHVHIMVPHPRCDEYLNDPTHVRPVTEAGLEMFSQRLNAEWDAIGAANTPLGKYLGIDFEVDSSTLDLKPRWREKLQRGEVTEQELRLAGDQQFNVFAQLTVELRAIKPAGRLVGRSGSSSGGVASDTAWGEQVNAALAEGNGAQAMAVMAAAVAAAPGDFEARAHLATLQHALGMLEPALENFQKVADAGVGGVELFNNLGVVAQELGRVDEAIAAYERAVALDPGNVTARGNLAEALGLVGRIKDAVAAYATLLQENPGNAEVHLGIAKLFISQGWFADALASLETAASIAPGNPEILNQKGIACREAGRHEEALTCFEAALQAAPGNLSLLVNRANALARLGRNTEAEALFRAAVAEITESGEPCPYELGFSFACFLLKQGRTDEGWSFYESRRQAVAIQHHPLEATLPQWRGEAVPAGAALLVTAEQGFGDSLQFVRLIPALAETFSRVCLQTRPALHKLLARSLAGVCEVVEDVPADALFDFICPIASLPLALRLSVGDWGMAAPYLKTDTMQSALWGFRIPAGRQRKIGICWSGGKSLRFKHRCDLPLATVDTLLTTTDVRWVSLQKEGDADWRRAQSQAGRLVDLMDMATSFDETAALIANLDLVITVDTSVAHVAGGLGKPVWLLLAEDADWRWLEGRDDSPWYPSMRIFRLRKEEVWPALGARVAAELAAMN